MATEKRDNELAIGCWVGHDSIIHWYPSGSKLGDRCFCGKETMSLYDLSRVRIRPKTLSAKASNAKRSKG